MSQPTVDDKNENSLGTFFSKLLRRNSNILQALLSLNKTPRGSCFKSEITFQEFSFPYKFPKPKNIFLRQNFGNIFLLKYKDWRKDFFMADRGRDSPRGFCFRICVNLFLTHIWNILHKFKFTRWKGFSSKVDLLKASN